MDRPLDLSSLMVAPPSPKLDRVKKPTAIPSGPKDPIGNTIRQKKIRNPSPPPSSRRRQSQRAAWNSKTNFACPFHKLDPKKFNSEHYEHCSRRGFINMSTLIEHIFGQHANSNICCICNRKFDSPRGLQSHREEKKPCGLDAQPKLPKDMAISTFLALRKVQYSRKTKTPEAEWQEIFEVLFPDVDRIFSPYFEPSVDQSEDAVESTVSDDPRCESPKSASVSYYGPRGEAPWMTTAATMAPKIGSKVQHTLRQAAEQRKQAGRDLSKKIEQHNKERVEMTLKKGMKQKQRDEEYSKHVEKDMRKSSMTHTSPYHVQPCLNDLLPYLSDLHGQEAKSLECGRQESQSSEPQPPVTKNGIIGTQHNFLMDRYLENDKTPPPRDDSPSHREARSPAVPSLSTGDNFGTELSPSDSRDSSASISGQSTELYEEDETHFSDFDGIYTSIGTSPSFNAVKIALFDTSTRQFWNFYNGLSISDLSDLWSKYATYTGAASSSQRNEGSTRTGSNTRIPSECPSNATTLLTPKRKNIDDEDKTNSNRNASKRSNRTSLQKEGLNLACPFHKYKPWMYNHGIRRFRTCSTTPFDAIFRLKEHLRRVHPLPLHCTRCWLPFANQDSLINHSQADIPCQRVQPVSVEGWSAEMDKKVTKRKDETERERWERIYRELFGRTLTNVPSPYFVPYDLATTRERDLETLLHQEVPRIVLNLMREEINDMEIPEAAQHLFNISERCLHFETMIGTAINEVFEIHRSATATSDCPEALPTPQYSSANPSIAGDSSTGQAALWENTPRVTPIDLFQSSRSQLGGFEPLPAVIPPKLSESTRQQKNATQQRAAGRSYLGSFDEQSSPLSAEMAPRTPETASNLFHLPPAGQLHSTGEQAQQDGYHDLTCDHGASMDEYVFMNFDLEGGFDDQAFANVSSDPNSASACSSYP